jgi:hypothetical protein
MRVCVQTCLVQLVQLLRVGSLTVGHGFLGRCGDVQLVRGGKGTLTDSDGACDTWYHNS